MLLCRAYLDEWWWARVTIKAHLKWVQSSLLKRLVLISFLKAFDQGAIVKCHTLMISQSAPRLPLLRLNSLDLEDTGYIIRALSVMNCLLYSWPATSPDGLFVHDSFIDSYFNDDFIILRCTADNHSTFIRLAVVVSIKSTKYTTLLVCYF